MTLSKEQGTYAISIMFLFEIDVDKNKSNNTSKSNDKKSNINLDKNKYKYYSENKNIPTVDSILLDYDLYKVISIFIPKCIVQKSMLL
ncbi:MAG: hypothetical protein IKD77_05810 [Bacilli bacterium]|nr:hypothetical protein [Bacilli bacterium]